jgi:hypothetical protein
MTGCIPASGPQDFQKTGTLMAGGGIKGGVVHGQTGEFSYAVKDPVRMRGFQAAVRHRFGSGHERFGCRYRASR